VGLGLEFRVVLGLGWCLGLRTRIRVRVMVGVKVRVKDGFGG
jgi:hypothetical protein